MGEGKETVCEAHGAPRKSVGHAVEETRRPVRKKLAVALTLQTRGTWRLCWGEW